MSCELGLPVPLLKALALISLLLQLDELKFGALWQIPFHFASGAGIPVSEKEGLSGHMPV